MGRSYSSAIGYLLKCEVIGQSLVLSNKTKIQVKATEAAATKPTRVPGDASAVEGEWLGLRVPGDASAVGVEWLGLRRGLIR